jgi:hypothetical protein
MKTLTQSFVNSLSAINTVSELKYFIDSDDITHHDSCLSSENFEDAPYPVEEYVGYYFMNKVPMCLEPNAELFAAIENVVQRVFGGNLRIQPEYYGFDGCSNVKELWEACMEFNVVYVGYEECKELVDGIVAHYGFDLVKYFDLDEVFGVI